MKEVNIGNEAQSIADVYAYIKKCDILTYNKMVQNLKDDINKKSNVYRSEEALNKWVKVLQILGEA